MHPETACSLQLAELIEYFTVINQTLLSCPTWLLQPQGDQQQTLFRSFTLGGIGLHTGEYGETPFTRHTL
jgi:hypothetical protein